MHMGFCAVIFSVELLNFSPGSHFSYLASNHKPATGKIYS